MPFDPTPTTDARDRALFLASAAVFALAAGLVLIRTLTLNSPIWGGDEYAYYIAGRAFPDTASLYVHDDHLQHVNNTLFFWLVHWGFRLFGYAEGWVKALNLVFFFAAAVLLFSVAGRQGGRGPAMAVTAVAALIPFSGYAASVMPDALYCCLCAALIRVMAVDLAVRPVRASAVAGLLLGLLLLTKPHALSLILALWAAFAALAVHPRGLRPRIALQGCLVATAVMAASIVLIKMLLTGAVEHRLIDLLGVFYANVVIGYGGVSHNILPDILRSLGAHLVLLLLVAGPAIALMTAQVLRGWRGDAPATDDPDQRNRLFLAVFVLLALGGATAMTAVFTAELVGAGVVKPWHDIYTRYNEFLIPFALLMLPAASGAGCSRTAIRIGAALSLAAALFWWLRGGTLFHMYPWNVTGMLAISQTPWAGKAGLAPPSLFLALACATQIATLLRPQRALLFGLGFLSLFWTGSTVEASLWQYQVSGGFSPLAGQARSVMATLPEEDRDHGLVIGAERWGRMDFALFGLARDNWILSKPQQDVAIAPGEIPEGTRWILTFGRFSLPPSYRTVLDSPPFHLFRPATGPATAGPAIP
ncbi:MAG: hypothetical protein F8N37_14445 [Telmatospirillum sp.]|nr:hypothetical protein [Telmatospirillum sp.]